MQVMNHVDILELIKINVFRPNVYKAGDIQVELEALEKGKVVVVDEDEIKKLNEALTHKCKEFEDARDPKVANYIKEFVGRMCSDWHRMGLLVLEDAPTTPDDPYKKAKEMFKNVR